MEQELFGKLSVLIKRYSTFVMLAKIGDACFTIFAQSLDKNIEAIDSSARYGYRMGFGICSDEIRTISKRNKHREAR